MSVALEDELRRRMPERLRDLKLRLVEHSEPAREGMPEGMPVNPLDLRAIEGRGVHVPIERAHILRRSSTRSSFGFRATEYSQSREHPSRAAVSRTKSARE